MPRRIILVLLSLFLLASSGGAALAQTAAPPAESWGTQPYAVEKPLFDAKLAELEGKIAALDARIAKTSEERDAYWQDWSDDERQQAREWFQRSTHYPAAGNRLNWAKEQSSAATSRLQAVLEAGSDVDIAADTDLSKARRERVWSAQLGELSSKLTERQEQAIYDGIELQAVKSYLGSLINRDLGMSVEDFAKDTVDDAWYVVRSHAQKFWDDMFDCAVKMVGRGVLRRTIAVVDPAFTTPPEVPGVVSTPEGVVMECLSDLARSALVNAFTAALRKNFVDDMVDQGIYPEVAEYWWAKFILSGEEPTGPNAPRVKPVLAAIRDRLEGAVERTMEQADQVGLEQAKKLLERELEVSARERLVVEVKNEALKAARAAQSEGARLSGATLRMESLQRATNRLGPKLYANDVSLRFAEGLDAAEVLLRQGYVLYSVLGSEMAFAEHGKPLIDEYWEIVRCLGKLEQGSGAHLVLQYYGWSEDVRREFFETCGKAKEVENLPQAQQMADRMAGLAALASARADRLMQSCQDGNARLDAAKGDIAAIEARLAEQQSFLDWSVIALSMLEGFVADVGDGLTDATTQAEEAERAKKRTDAAAEQACDMAEKVRAATDAGDQRSKLDEVVAAEATAREQAEASRAAAQKSAASAKTAVTAAEQLIGELAELVRRRDAAADLAPMFDSADLAIADAEREAAAAATAGQDLARAAREASVLLASARGLLATPAQTDVLRQKLATIEELYASVKSAAATDDGCAKRLAAAAAALKEKLEKTRSTSERVAKEVAAELEGADIEKLGDEVASQAEQARATGDVAEAIAGAAASTAADAGSCLELARAALQGGEAELAAAARAALGQCDFVRAKDAIERLPAGPERLSLVEAYRAAYDREKHTKALWDAADAAFQDGDNEDAYGLLEEALANTQCDSYKARIAVAMTQVVAQQGDDLAAAARDAIANCDFTAAGGYVDKLEEGGWPVAAELRAALEAAMSREEQAIALYEEGMGHSDWGDNAVALSTLRQAQGLAQCEKLKGDIAASIAFLEGVSSAPTPTPDEGSTDTGVAPVTPITPNANWTGPWRGTMQLRDLVVDGQRMSPRDLVARIDREWQAYVARRNAENNPLSPMEIDITGNMKELVKSGLLLLGGPLPISFLLQPEGNGYRLALPGAPPPSKDNPALVQFVQGLPPLAPDGQGGWRADLSDKGSTVNLSVAAADTLLSKVNFSLTLHFQAPGDVQDAGSSFNIRSLTLAIAGSTDAGETGYAELVAEYQRLLRERAGR